MGAREVEAIKVVVTSFTGLTCFDVVGVDGDVAVSIRSAVLMPSTQGMEDLVHYHAFAHTRRTNGDVLLPSSSTNGGKTAEKKSSSLSLSRYREFKEYNL